MPSKMIKSLRLLHTSLRIVNARFYYKSGTQVPPFKDPDLKRPRHGLTRTHMDPDPVVELPDWSYADGRPAPLGTRKKQRLLLQMQFAKTITELLKEIEFAEKHHLEVQEEREREKENIINNKLKKKGKNLYPKENSS